MLDSTSGKVGKKQLKLRFQVTDVSKPLASVRRIVENGNEVCFGLGEKDNYIVNRASGDKLILRPNGRGSYLMDVSFVGGEKTSITVDSGAEENVCPWEWGEQFGIQQVEEMKFRNASGILMGHWGQHDVMLTSPF